MNKKPTICCECKHHYNKQDGPRTLVWYNWFCHHPANKKPPAKDWVTGKIGYGAANDLGRSMVVDEAFPYCRDINTGGECELFSQ